MVHPLGLVIQSRFITIDIGGRNHSVCTMYSDNLIDLGTLSNYISM